MSSNEISSQMIDINTSNNNWEQQFVSKISSSSSNSSSSTELCDDEHLKDNDLGSSPEVARKTSNQISNVNNNNDQEKCQVKLNGENESAKNDNQSLNSRKDTKVNNNEDKIKFQLNLECENRFIKNQLSKEDKRNSSLDIESYSLTNEFTNLTLDECIKKLNEKMSSLNE